MLYILYFICQKDGCNQVLLNRIIILKDIMMDGLSGEDIHKED